MHWFRRRPKPDPVRCYKCGALNPELVCQWGPFCRSHLTGKGVKTMQDREDHYRQEWATKTGKTPREIYVPEAIRKVEEKKEKK